jgi:signal transduction histidine kinase
MTQTISQSILIVDDTPANLNVLSTMLSQRGYKVRPAISGSLALMSVTRDLPDLILLDIRMAEMDGYEVCRRLKADERTRDVPVIFISALDDIEDKLRAFQSGGVDYITKPFQVEEVLARVQAHITLQDQRRRIAAQLAQIEQLSHFKDELLRVVSHDLKNPIGAVMGYAELLREESGEAEVADYAARILKSAQFMNALVNDLLTLSHAEGDFPLDLHRGDLNDLVASCLPAHELAAQEKQIALHWTPASAPLHAQFDPMRLSQVLNNLISNAIKYTPAGGTVKIAARGSDKMSVISVADTGFGIPDADLPRIFDKFYRVNTKEHLAVTGTGLGLPIAKAFIEKHGGQIGVTSAVGAGSTFTVSLPLMG